MKRPWIPAAAFGVCALLAATIGAAFLLTARGGGIRPEKTLEEYMQEGDLYLENGQQQMALVCYKEAAALEENSQEALRKVAETYVSLSYTEEARDSYRVLVEEREDASADDYYGYIYALIRADEREKAREITKEALPLFEDDRFDVLIESMDLEAPQFSRESGTVSDYFLLELTNAVPHAVVRYTTDGSEPDEESDIFREDIVISAPENRIRAKAYSYLGYESAETVLEIRVSREPEVVYKGRRYGGAGTLEQMSRNMLYKEYDEDIYDYELAQIRSLYVSGTTYSMIPLNAVFYEDSYTIENSTHTNRGNLKLEGIERLCFLKTLGISFQKSLDLTPVAGLEYLEELSLLNNHITDIGVIGDLKGLKRLALGWNEIEDISPLRTLTELESLGLWNNNITDISAVSGLTKLTYLDIANNRVTRIDAISNLSELQELWINGNVIPDKSPMESLPKLRIVKE